MNKEQQHTLECQATFQPHEESFEDNLVSWILEVYLE